MSESISREDFVSKLNTGFTAYFTEGIPTPLELIDVTKIIHRRDYECFSLIFRGPADGPLRQYTLAVEHPDLGAMDLALVPVASDPNGLQYEALFNRKMQDEPSE
jgi:hypothetical protein